MSADVTKCDGFDPIKSGKIAVELSDALIYVYKVKEDRRFMVFNKHKKQELWTKAKK